MLGDELAQRFISMLEEPDYPCVGAKSVLHRNTLRVLVCSHAEGGAEDRRVVQALQEFGRQCRASGEELSSFAVLYSNARRFSEREFEDFLWTRLQSFHDIDSRSFGWDPEVSSDVRSPDFSFSIGGMAFFVIGMHPGSNRRARCSEVPALIFNPHAQFEELRRKESFASMRDLIRRRERHYSGSIHPMLDDHGRSSEALQYSGRVTGRDHVCPFSPRRSG